MQIKALKEFSLTMVPVNINGKVFPISLGFYYGVPIVRLQSVKTDVYLFTNFLFLWFQISHRKSKLKFMCKCIYRIVMLSKFSCIIILILIK